MTININTLVSVSLLWFTEISVLLIKFSIIMKKLNVF